jgi:hypothetical protein
MSHNKRHGTAEQQLRHIPKLPRIDNDVTNVDIVVAPFGAPLAPPRRDPIPSITSAARVSSATPRPNVIPFAQPRTIAAMAAANPKSVVINDASRAPMTLEPQRFYDPPTRIGSPPIVAPATPNTVARNPVAAPATRVATGWTPPGAVPIVKPAAPVVTSSPTLYPTFMPAPVMAAQSMPAVQSPPPHVNPTAHVAAPSLPPITTTRPATQMPIALPELEPAAPDLRGKWAAFEALGLGAKLNSQTAGKLVVSAYRLLGFAILTIIVFVLVGYIANTAFFYMSDSWVVPMAISPTDEKVVGLQAQLSEQQNTRDRIADEFNQAERAIAAQQQFQAEFAKAIKRDLAGRTAALGRIRALANAAAATRVAIRNQNSAYAASSRKKMAQEYAAGLIDRNTMLSGKFQMAQITSSNLSLAERQAEFETRAAELEAQAESLDAVLENKQGDEVALSYEVLRIKQEYESSKLDLAKAIEARDTLKQSLVRQDKIVASLQSSSWLRAINDKASVAFVPYGNLSNVEKGTSVYACRVGMVVCRHIGDVLEVLPGEVQFKHPQRDRMLRGQMVELKLDAEDADAASDDVLFVGGKPLFF